VNEVRPVNIVMVWVTIAPTAPPWIRPRTNVAAKTLNNYFVNKVLVRVILARLQVLDNIILPKSQCGFPPALYCIYCLFVFVFCGALQLVGYGAPGQNTERSIKPFLLFVLGRTGYIVVL